MRKLSLASSALAAGLVLSACGGGGESTVAASEPVEATDGSNPADVAEANIGALQTTDDGRTTEVINIADGGITNLQQVVTGDRPVLLWFWAPH